LPSSSKEINTNKRTEEKIYIKFIIITIPIKTKANILIYNYKKQNGKKKR